MRKILNWFRDFFGSSQNTDAKVALIMMSMTQEEEISCDDVQALIDQFAEMQFRGENPASLFPLVQRHLEMCPECREEFEALLVAVEASQA